MVFTAFRAIEGTRGENPLIYMIFRRYRYHSAIIISRIQPDIAVERNSRQAKAENSTENRILHWFLKGIFIFAQWFWGPQLVLYKWLWSKLSNYSMIFRPKMHDFGTYLTIVLWFFCHHGNGTFHFPHTHDMKFIKKNKKRHLYVTPPLFRNKKFMFDEIDQDIH